MIGDILVALLAAVLAIVFLCVLWLVGAAVELVLVWLRILPK